MDDFDYVWVFVRPEKTVEFAMIPPAPVFQKERRMLRLLKSLTQWILKISLSRVL